MATRTKTLQEFQQPQVDEGERQGNGHQEAETGQTDPYHHLRTCTDIYIRHRDGRMQALKEEITAGKALLDELHRHNLRVWEYNGLTVELVAGKEKVRVRRAKDDADPEQEEVLPFEGDDEAEE